MHFEWLLDVRHGADYFRRWHRDKANSGGLLVHKASHHFDLVNWWLGAPPVTVFAQRRLFFYGQARRRRTATTADTSGPTAIRARRRRPVRPRAWPTTRELRELYLDAEAEDGYLRDRNVFADGVSIEDDMSVLVRYSTGATMTLPPARLRALGGLPGDGQRRRRAASSWRLWRATTSVPTWPAQSRATHRRAPPCTGRAPPPRPVTYALTRAPVLGAAP